EQARRSVEAVARIGRSDGSESVPLGHAQSPSNSPIGFKSSIRSQNAFTTTSIGTANSVPQIPQTKLQKIRPMNMATSLVRAARLVSQGVSSHPSRLVMTTDTPATESAIAIVSNCRNPATAVAAATITGPK